MTNVEIQGLNKTVGIDESAAKPYILTNGDFYAETYIADDGSFVGYDDGQNEYIQLWPTEPDDFPTSHFTIREYLKRIEDAGTYCNGQIRNGKIGTYWADKDNGRLYEYETDDENLSADDLSTSEIVELFEDGVEL